MTMRKILLRKGFIVFFIFLITGLSCCVQDKDVSLPAVKVEFSHHNITGKHFLQLNNIESVMINKSDAPTLFKEPPFPGIHLFAYNSLKRTPVTYVPIDKEGDNLVAYIGFLSPESVPENGTEILIYIDVVDPKGKILASRSSKIIWDIDFQRE